MQTTIISDTICLIPLDKIGELHLLQKLFGKILTTRIVAEEFGKQLPDWIIIQNPNHINYQSALEIFVDKGEASVILLASEQKESLLIIDDRMGRKLVKQVGLNITGTLGVLAAAKQSGHISILKPLLDKITQTDFRLSNQLVQEILRQVGE